MFNNIFGRRKTKTEDTSPSGTPTRHSPIPVELRQPDPSPGFSYPLYNANQGNADYEQLYTFNDWTVIGPKTLESRGDQSAQIPYLQDVPFKSTIVSADDLKSIKDLDLLLLQFSTKLSSTQALVGEDYDFSMENQLLEELEPSSPHSSASSPDPEAPKDSPNGSNEEEQQMAQLLEFASLTS